MAGLRVYRSNHIELLAELLAQLLLKEPPSDPFAPIEVVVGSRGMERWLRHTLAERIGVCANMVFPFPTSRLDAIVGEVLGADTTAADRWEPDALAWALLEVLPSIVERAGFESVRGYVETWDGPVGAKAYGLARQLADVFDGYVVYRPEQASAWSAGKRTKLPKGSDGLAWQYQLWQALHAHLEGAPHRADRIAEAERLLREGTATPSLTGPLRLFGISSLPPLWMPLLGALSKQVDVELFLLCPSNEYWADLVRPRVRSDRSAWRLRDRETIVEALRDPERGEVHPLLLSMGRVARDFQIVLESQADDYEDARVDLFLDGSGGAKEAFPDPAATTNPRALQRLQSDLLHARPPAPLVDAAELEASDDSLQFHHCYGPTRQVEVLRDVLLGLFEDHPELEPRDVVVMTPDIETYAPLVTAVFSQGQTNRREKNSKAIRGGDGWGPVGAPYIPFEVADLSVRRLNPVADAMMRVLELAGGRFEASVVLDLLTLEPVRRRFGLSPEELLTVRQWIGDSGIRWARDAAHRQQAAQPADPQNTWRFGLRRLLLGVVLAEDGRMLTGVDVRGEATTVRTFDDMEGSETDLLGKLVDFTNTLFALTDSLGEPRQMSDWISALEEVLERLTLTSASASWLTRRARDGIEQLAAAASHGASQRQVSLEAIRGALSGHFDVASRVTKEQSGAVVFCAMQPMRSVPYRVVCLLGMDDGALPRRGSGFAFDLTASAPRVGDRTPRDEDRYLMLEAMLSARQHLVVLHSGHDPRTNEELPACVPVGELRDLIDQSFPCPAGASSPSAWMTTHHPLQPFGQRAFLPQHRDPNKPGVKRAWSFDRRLLAGAEAVRRPRQAAPPFFPADDSLDASTSDEIALSELIRFFNGPTAYLMKQRLKVSLREHGQVAEDREPIELDGLQRWQLRDQLLRGRLKGQGSLALRQGMRAEGLLPLGYAGDATVDMESALTERMLRTVQIWPDGAAAPIEPDEPLAVDIQLSDARITGTLDNIYGQYLIDPQFGTERAKKILGAWLELVAWHACRDDAGSAIVVLGGLAKGEPTVSLMGYQAPADPRGYLERLVAIYRRGCTQPIKLFPASSWMFAWDARSLPNDPELFAAGLPDDANYLEVIRKAHDHAVASWWPGFASQGDIGDPHIERVFDGQPPMSDWRVQPVPVDLEFAQLAMQLWKPLFARRKTTAPVKKWVAGGLR